MSEFEIKDSGERAEFSGGMVRDTTEGKTNFLNVLFGPLFRRYASHLTKGRVKYPDPQPGVPNWTLAEGLDEYLRAKESAFRHFTQWLYGERDEDHAVAVVFNMNLAEYVLEKDPSIDPAAGAVPPKPVVLDAADVSWSKPTIFSSPGAMREMTSAEYQKLRDTGQAHDINGTPVQVWIA